MKTISGSIKLFGIFWLVILAAGCSTMNHREQMLSTAGFKVVIARTPAQQQKLQLLPPGKFTQTRRHGREYYIFPDAAHDRIFLGTKREYQNYQQMILNNQIADQDRVDAEMASTDGADWDDWGDWEVFEWNSD